jgi:hypothetical protein
MWPRIRALLMRPSRGLTVKETGMSETVEYPTYDHNRRHQWPGISVPQDADHLPHLQPGPVVPVAPGSLEPDAAEEAVVKPVLAKPVPVREPAPEPARDGELARAYLAKG